MKAYVKNVDLPRKKKWKRGSKSRVSLKSGDSEVEGLNPSERKINVGKSSVTEEAKNNTTLKSSKLKKTGLKMRQALNKNRNMTDKVSSIHEGNKDDEIKQIDSVNDDDKIIENDNIENKEDLDLVDDAVVDDASVDDDGKLLL